MGISPALMTLRRERFLRIFLLSNWDDSRNLCRGLKKSRNRRGMDERSNLLGRVLLFRQREQFLAHCFCEAQFPLSRAQGKRSTRSRSREGCDLRSSLPPRSFCKRPIYSNLKNMMTTNKTTKAVERLACVWDFTEVFFFQCEETGEERRKKREMDGQVPG